MEQRRGKESRGETPEDIGKQHKRKPTRNNKILRERKGRREEKKSRQSPRILCKAEKKVAY